MSKCHLTENWSWVEFFGVDGCLIVGAFPKFRIFTQHLSSASRKLQRSRPLKLKVKVLSSLKSFLCTVFLFIFHYRRRSESAPNFKYVGPPLSWLERILMAFEKKSTCKGEISIHGVHLLVYANPLWDIVHARALHRFLHDVPKPGILSKT